MDYEIRPEPSDEERAAIVAALDALGKDVPALPALEDPEKP